MTTFTVSAVNNQFNGIALYVAVLTGATEAGGNSAAAMGSGVLSTSFTPTFTNSLIAVSLGNLANNTSFTLAANHSAFATFTDSTNNWAADLAHYTGTVTAATPVTVGATAPAATNPTGYAIYEIKASGGSTPTIDASSVGANSTTNTATTASFTPPANSVLVALVAENGTGAGGTTTVSDTAGLGLTWTSRASASGAWVYTTSIGAAGAAGAAAAASGTGAALNPSIVLSTITVGPRYAGTATDLGGVYGSWGTPSMATGGP